jgi:N-acetyl-anhydromuramyl-L-alanine amidase AmpD
MPRSPLHRVLAGLLGCFSLASLAAQPAAAAQAPSPTLGAVTAAASARRVPVALLEAIGYTSTHWRMQVAADGTVGPMRLAPGSSLAQAAALTGRSQADLRTSVPANFDAGAAWLAAQSQGTLAGDLASWRPAVIKLLGAGSAGAVYDLLARGLAAPAPTGELITISAHPSLAASSPVTAPRDSSAPQTDYPGSRWVAADPNNFDVHNRPAEPVINLVIIHVAEGSYDGTVAAFQNPATNASSTYVMRSSDGASTQMVREKDVSWNAGNADYSMSSVALEHEGFTNDPSWFTDAMYQGSARIVASVVRKYDIPIDRQHIIGHNEVPDPNNPGQFGGRDHHTDPGPYWNWNKYMALVAQYAACPPASDPTVQPAAVAGVTSAVVGLDCGMWVHRDGTPGFYGLGGTLAGAPAVTAPVGGLGPLYIATFSDHNLNVRSDGRRWQSLMAGTTSYCIDNPAAAVTSTTLYVACEGKDLALWYASAPLQPGVLPQVGGWTSAGGILAAGPAIVISRGAPLYHVIGIDGYVYSHDVPASGWTKTTFRCFGHPALATVGMTLLFACHGVDGALWYSINSGAGWVGAKSLGGLVGNGVGIAVTGPTPVAIFYGEGVDFHLWQRGLKSGWVSDGGTASYGAAASGP